MFFFFFSSRRRHTRLTCDWSSDVCSSDLDRRVDAEMMSLVDDAQVALSCEGIDPILPIEHVAYEVEGIPVHASLLCCRSRAHESPELSLDSGHAPCVDRLTSP